MKISITSTQIIRFCLVIILIMHSIPGMLDGGVNAFGKMYLDEQGFAPYGIYLAWAIKLSHVINAITLIINKYNFWPSVATIIVLVVGIFMVHLPDGWFVVGGGRNGIEYNFLLIGCFLAVIISKIK
jgi:putative oxidoreductase